MARLSVRDALATAALGPRARPSRSLLSMLGVALGIATLVAVLGITATNEDRLRLELEALGSNVLEVRPGVGPDLTTVPLPSEAPGMVRRIGPVLDAARVSPVAGAGVYRTDLVPDTMGGALAVVAVQAELADTMDLRMAEGQWFDRSSTALPTTVLGSVAASELGIVEIGQRVWVDDDWYAVVGILEPARLAPTLDRAALIGEDWSSRTTPAEEDTVLYVRVRTGAVDPVRDVLAATVNPAIPRAVTVSQPSVLAHAQRAVDSTFASLALGLAAVALLVGAIGIVNTMVIAVLERRGEIALRRAVGARAGQIRAQFVLEAGFLGLGGGVAGATLGVLVTSVYALTHGMPPTVDMVPSGVGVALSVVVGVVAGVYPATRAARLPPMAGLRGD
ncbi:ABC transporter permease [Isoptericola haloaureus]|uniref:FtsX-like permease family protein n=1 Tax=Isoptericola haloaureus TaxID=1542902 RepID=A0ABU7Z9K0_9MICO